jgi:hypothetical protein
MVQNIIRGTAAAVSSLGLVAGFSGIAGASAVIHDTGPQSSNHVYSSSKTNTDVRNTNHLHLMSSNYQSGYSGSAMVNDNTTGGSANSGNVSNSSSSGASVAVTNTMPTTNSDSSSDPTNSNSMNANSSISETGPSSSNKVVTTDSTNTCVTNTNDIKVSTTNDQTASTGNAKVTDNTTGGNATSGSVSNSSSDTYTVMISN